MGLGSSIDISMHAGLSDAHELVSTDLGWQQTGANMENMTSLARGHLLWEGSLTASDNW